MKLLKIFCISFLLIILSLIANFFFKNPETPIRIKIVDISFKLIQLYTGLGSPDFSREKLYITLPYLTGFFTAMGAAKFYGLQFFPSKCGVREKG